MYQPAVYQFRLTIVINGVVSEQYTRRTTWDEVWREAQAMSAEMAQVYADYAVRMECVL